MATSIKTKVAKLKASKEEFDDALGLSMLSLSGFQVYHLGGQKLFPYFLVNEKKRTKRSRAK
tara:strand:- start:197 stop:382 length:186 start_codon:yes stop_codon:yes gene_type:complete